MRKSFAVRVNPRASADSASGAGMPESPVQVPCTMGSSP